MGSNYFGNDHQRGSSGGGLSPSSCSSPSSSSSRKGKKNGSDKPKQPQRGLGVAQLEKIRIHSEMGCNYLPSLHTPYTNPNFNQEDIRLQTAYSSSTASFSYSSSSPSSYGFQTPQPIMMGLPDLDRAHIRYEVSHSQPTTIARWHPGNPVLGSQQFVDPNMTRSFFEPGVEGSPSKENKNSSGTSSRNSDEEDIDLELRL